MDKISADLNDLKKEVRKNNDKNEQEWWTEVVSINKFVKIFYLLFIFSCYGIEKIKYSENQVNKYVTKLMEVDNSPEELSKW